MWPFRVHSLAFLIYCAPITLLADAQSDSAPTQARSDFTFPCEAWQPQSSSEKANWSAEKLGSAHIYANSIHSSAVMIIQGGHVVDQWGEIDKKICAYSVRKSLISALYGIYSDNGVIDINQTLDQLGIDDSPEPLTNEEKQARVVDLLRARSGVYHVVDFETELMKRNRPARGSHPPGTFWYYNNWDFNALGTIFERAAGLSIGEAFEQRVAAPLQMEDFHTDDVYYVRGPESV